MRKSTDTDAIGVTEHHPSCQARCAQECGMSPRRAHADENPWVRVRTFHDAPVLPVKRPPAPLWERIEDWSAVTYHRESGCEIVDRPGKVRTLLGLPLPADDGYERAARHDLDRWLRLADRDLDDAREAYAAQQRNHARRALDVGEIAALFHAAFPGIAGAEPSKVVKRAKGATARQRELLTLAVGDAPTAPAQPSPWTPMHEATRHIRDVMTVHAWALALILFGRERDTLSDYALGRLLKGEPVKDTRAPFANAAHALSVAARDLPGLGGGSCAWPSEDPRMRLRTWAKPGEMTVKGSHAGTDSVRGEAGVHRVLDARNVARRAALEPHERAAVAVLDDRNLTRDEKALRLREIEALRRGLTVPADDPKELRHVTADVSDGQLYGRAKAARDRVRAAVERVSREGDALAPARPVPSRPAPAPRPLPPLVLADLPAGCL